VRREGREGKQREAEGSRGKEREAEGRRGKEREAVEVLVSFGDKGLQSRSRVGV